MPTPTKLINLFLSHDGVNQSWVAGKLYGSKSRTNTTKLRNKHLGIEGRSFTEEELIRLDEIRRQFIASLL